MAKFRAKLVALLLTLDRLTMNTASAPSSTVTLLAAGVAALLTVLMVGVPSLSMMPPMALTPPMTSGKVSVAAESMTESSMVWTLTVKLATPAGTLILPVLLL